MASYALAPVLPVVPVTVYGGFQHITYMNPSIYLAPGIRRYRRVRARAVNNTAYAKGDKQLNVYWAGARYSVTPQFTAAIAYYGEKQFAYATGAECGLLDGGGRLVQRKLQCGVRVARLPLHQALRHLRAAPCGRTCRMAWRTGTSTRR